jgi:F-type H+-transporting ATPase subunit gamma
MAEREREIRDRIQGIRGLHAVVNALRAQAAGPTAQTQAALPGLRKYADVVGDALAEALSLLPPKPPAAEPPLTPPSHSEESRPLPKGLIVFCAEHGFSGAFSRHIIESVIAEAGSVELFIIGSRGLRVARERNLRVSWSRPMSSHFDAIPDLVNDVTERIYGKFTAGALSGVDIVYGLATATGASSIERQSLLPVDPSRLKRIAAVPGTKPITYMAPEKLVERLVGEYFFAQLAHAAIESFASENAARLATMDGARRHIEEKLADLTRQERLARQEQITAEILDVLQPG